MVAWVIRPRCSYDRLGIRVLVRRDGSRHDRVVRQGCGEPTLEVTGHVRK